MNICKEATGKRKKMEQAETLHLMHSALSTKSQIERVYGLDETAPKSRDSSSVSTPLYTKQRVRARERKKEEGREEDRQRRRQTGRRRFGKYRLSHLCYVLLVT